MASLLTKKRAIEHVDVARPTRPAGVWWVVRVVIDALLVKVGRVHQPSLQDAA